MTADPWPLTPAPAPVPPTVCAVCGGETAGWEVIVAQPHTYHRGCYTAFHAAVNDRANLTKTIAEIRMLVTAAKGGQ